MNKPAAKSLRLLAATAVTALAAYGVVLPPATAVDAPPTPRPRATAQPAPPPASGTTGRATPVWGLNPAPGQDCPAGSTRTTTLASSTFDGGTGAPFTVTGAFTSEGGAQFVRQAGGGAPVADLIASPDLAPTDPWRVYVKMDVRGDFAAQDLVVTPRYGGTAWAVASAAQAQVSPSTWRTVHLDLTDGANERTLGDPFNVVIARDAGTGTVDIDNLSVYACTPPLMGEPGDFNGDGFADAKFIMRNGDLLMSGGTPTRSATLWKAGNGWQSMTWIGSVGDTNGDGYTDLMARTAGGDMLVYFGDGVRSFGRSQRVGWGWQGMTAILPVGDVNGDGMQDVIARDPAGNMRFYTYRSDGTMTGGRVVGTVWNVFRHIVAIRNTAVPGTPTRLYGILANGDMLSYTVTKTGDMYGTGTKVGNGWFFPRVGSVGDFDGDGLDDVLAVTATGSAYIYPTNGPGAWKGIKTLQETIWNAALVVG